MICAAVKGETLQELAARAAAADRPDGIVELRLDALKAIPYDGLHALIRSIQGQVLLTLRCRSQGGSYVGSEEERLQAIKKLAALKPTFIDVEALVPAPFFNDLKAEHPSVKWIVSVHDFEKTPTDLDDLLTTLRRHCAHYYKIAATARDTNDMLRLMVWAQDKPDVIAVSMGVWGSPGRIIAPRIGSPLTYGCLTADEETAPGQLGMDEMLGRYRADAIDRQTVICGLIGDPVDTSISDRTHNSAFAAFGINARYLKMRVKEGELADFLREAKRLPIRGISVTMPLKEAIIPHLDAIDAKAVAIGAVNTLLFQQGKVFGYNTDAMGALDALEETCPVAGQHMVILGAGGAAKAIAYEAMERGSRVTIVNRDGERALHLARLLGCRAYPLQQMGACAAAGYDILVNTTPAGMPIATDDIVPGSVVMDIKSYPLKSGLLEAAGKRGCPLVYGYQMFVGQAVGQFALWFPKQVDQFALQAHLTDRARRILE